MVYSTILLGNYIILNTSLLDLKNLSGFPHNFEFAEKQSTVFGSSLYVISNSEGDDSIGSYFIDPEGNLQKKWGIIDEDFKSGKSGDDRTIIIKEVGAANNKFIALLCQVPDIDMQNADPFRSIHLLDIEGKFVGERRFPIEEPIEDDSTGNYHMPYHIPMHLVDDILIYKTPEDEHLNFWHIPTNQIINRFKWNGSEIYDIHSTDKEITFLTGVIGSDEEMKYQIIQLSLVDLIRK